MRLMTGLKLVPSASRHGVYDSVYIKHPSGAAVDVACCGAQL